MTTHDTPVTESPARRKMRLRHRLLAAASVCTILAAAGIFLQRARQETALREAFLPQLETRAKQEPTNGRLLALTAARLTEANDYAGAAEYLSRAVRAGETDEVIWRTWAAAVAASGDREQAGTILLTGVKAAPNPAPIQAAIERCRKLDPSVSVEKLAETICPEGVRALTARYTQGSFLNGWTENQGKGSPEQSGFATREQWAKDQPQNPEALRLWGEALMRNRRYVEAETTLRRAIELKPESPEIRLALADTLRERGEFGKAGLEYIACLKRKKDWFPALMGMGQVALEKKLLKIGTETFELAVKQNPQSADAWLGLGRAHYARRLNLSRSLEAFQIAAKLAPTRTDFFTAYSNALRVNFKYDEAEAILRRRLSADANDAQAHYLLALLLLDIKPSPARRTEAETALRNSQRLAPEVSATDTRLAQLLVEDNKLDEAVPLLEAILKRERNNVVAYKTLSRAFRKQGKTKEADILQTSANELGAYLQRVMFLEDMLQRQPDNLKAHRELADLYERGGEPEKAAREQEMIAVLVKHPEMAIRGIRDMNAATALGTPQK